MDVRIHRRKRALRVGAALIMVAVLLLLQSPQPAQASVLETVGDFLSLGANTVREIQEAIVLATGEARELLEQLKNDIEGLLKSLEEAYQRNLNITLDSLDSFTRNLLLELTALIDSVNRELQETIQLGGEVAKDVIREASLQVRRTAADLEQRLKGVIITGGETGAFLLDRATYNIVLVTALILFGLGLLIFIWLLFTRRVPHGVAGVLAGVFIVMFLVTTGTLVFVPPARAYAMTFIGVGLEQRLEKVADKPRILDVFPATVIVGKTTELDVWGSSLQAEGRRPTARMADQTVPVKAASNEQVVLDVASLNLPVGATEVVLIYDGAPGPAAVVRVANAPPPPAPPDLVISGFSINPASPVQGLNATASITITNIGRGPAPAFKVLWRPDIAAAKMEERIIPGLDAASGIGPLPPLGPAVTGRRAPVAPTVPAPRAPVRPRVPVAPGTPERPTGIRRPIRILPGGVLARPVQQNAVVVEIDYAYPNPGSFDSVASVALVDPLGTIRESNVDNNSDRRRISVQPKPERRATVVVTIDSVTILNDSEPIERGKGDIYFEFKIGGRSGRFPSSGDKAMSRGRTYGIGQRFEFVLTEGQPLTLFANGTETDWPDDDDRMGTIGPLAFSSDIEWNKGSRSFESVDPRNYVLHVTIEVTWLP